MCLICLKVCPEFITGHKHWIQPNRCWRVPRYTIFVFLRLNDKPLCRKSNHTKRWTSAKRTFQVKHCTKKSLLFFHLSKYFQGNRVYVCSIKPDVSTARRHQTSPVTILYTRPPQHDHTKVPIMAKGDWFTSRCVSIGHLILEISLLQTLTLKMQGQRKRRDQGAVVGPVSNWSASFPFHINYLYYYT